MTKQTDYGIVLLAKFAATSFEHMHTARDLAEETRLPLPMVSKILKVLGREGLLVSHRGVKGGYSLARRPDQISMIDVIGALEGRVAITECSLERPGSCRQEPICPVRTNWQRINQVIRDALSGLTLAEMIHPLSQARTSMDVRGFHDSIGLPAGTSWVSANLASHASVAPPSLPTLAEPAGV